MVTSWHTRFLGPVALAAEPCLETETAEHPAAELLEVWFRDYFARLWRLVARLGVARESIDDVVQDTFITASRRHADIHEGREWSFLVGIAVRLGAHQRVRSAARREVFQNELLEQEASALPDAEQLLIEKRLREELTAVGDLDGDGLQDAVLYDDSGVAHLVYGAAGVFDSGIDLAQASATFEPFAGVTASSSWELQIGPAGDLDGDGDQELVLSRQVGSAIGTGAPHVVALLSGSAQRLSGTVEFPTLSNPNPDDDMVVEQVFPIGDLDGDGVDELATRSGYYIVDSAGNYGRRDEGTALNIHYGIPGSESRPPR